MKTAYKFLLAGSVAGGAVAAVVAARRSARAAQLRASVGSIGSAEIRRLRDEAGHAIESSLAAFQNDGTGGPAASGPNEDLRRLEATLDELASALAPDFAATVRSLTESIAAAQAHLMAFDLNRANHGDADSSERKARKRASETFKSEVEPLLASIESAIS